ncbi:MAG TPA: P1 family peptidase [Vicinamibacterales bacterium]|nr:P1 family peptidase [Vicinamibacterales bacterium]
MQKHRLILLVTGIMAIVVALPRGQARDVPPTTDTGITRVPGIKVGQLTLDTRPTGCTVILTPANTVGAVDVRGGAPGTVETDLLRPDELVSTINAVIFAGGSAFGLAARDGVMKYLEEQKIGYAFGGAFVPIVSGAILFDLPIGDNPRVRPDAVCGYEAAARATTGRVAEGSVGAGAGATIGKFGGPGHAMKGGVGTTSLTLTDGLIVGVLVVVNASGSIVDPKTGKPVAGVRAADGKSLEDPFALVRRGVAPSGAGGNTTLGVVATNARLSKAQALKVASMAHDGFARTIVPSHTMSDGDTIFSLATGQVDADVNRVGVLAAEATSDAILRAVRLAKGLPGFPGVADLK